MLVLDVKGFYDKIDKAACRNAGNSLEPIAAVAGLVYGNKATVVYKNKTTSTEYKLVAHNGTIQGLSISGFCASKAMNDVAAIVRSANPQVSMPNFHDDGRIDGRFDDVFKAFDEFAAAIQARLGLTINFKDGLGILPVDPLCITVQRADMLRGRGIPVLKGIVQSGIPVGPRSWIKEKLDEKVEDVRADASEIVGVVGKHDKLTRKGLTSVVRLTTTAAFSHLIRGVAPSVNEEAARRIDRIAVAATLSTGGLGHIDPRAPRVSERILLSTECGGAGVGSMAMARDAAFIASFVATQPLASELDDWFWGKLAWIAEGTVRGMPGIATVFVVLLLTRALADVLGYFFNAVQHGRLVLPFLHSETTTATRRIVIAVVWVLGVAFAYPYLPGSSSDAFKGLSILAGVMVTLGSSGLVTQAMSGLVVIYSRALRRCDFVEVNGVQGVVTEVASLAIKMITVRNEEITIPNSVLVSSPIHNYSKLASSHGMLLTSTVTIGYDAPWRQVHAMLEEAARRTPRVRREPAPYVYQRALSDFYVEYELFVGIDSAIERVSIQSALHASILDVFNEYGVQIMSPHFRGQPEGPVVVHESDWFKAPARPPS